MDEAKPDVSGKRARSRTSTDRVVLVAGDVELFKLLYEYRLLRREHLSILTSRPLKRLHRRLLKLAQSDYITTIKLPQQKHIYGLGRLALPVLVEEGIADDELLHQRSRIHELKELFLKHEMMIVDLHVTLSLATRGNPLRLVDWREGKELHDRVTVQDHNAHKSIPVRPDAFFTLEDSRREPGGNRAHYFLEADRSSENHRQFKDKIRGYFHYIEQGLHNRKFGIKHFRVLTVATTDARATNLAAMTQELLPERGRKYFFFSSLKTFSIESPAPILDSVHLSPRDIERRYPLLPAPGAQVP